MRLCAHSLGGSSRTILRDGSIRLRLLALAASLAAVVCFLLIQRPAWFFPSTASITRLPSAGTSELSLREGRLYRAGETVGFTGLMLETYEGGVQKSRTSISNGLIHGLSEGWHTNGQLQVSEVFKEGKSHGIRTKYYSNGTNLSQATIVDGRIEGQFRRWHENGRLAEQIDMKDGVPHGVSLTYFPSGYLRAQTVLSNGATVTQKFWRDGQLKEAPATTP